MNQVSFRSTVELAILKSYQPVVSPQVEPQAGSERDGDVPGPSLPSWNRNKHFYLIFRKMGKSMVFFTLLKV